MLRALALAVVVTVSAHAEIIHPVSYNVLQIPITPFSNMASGYQATNPGFRAVLFSEKGQFIAGGPMSIDAIITGFTDDASKGSSYGRLVLNIDMSDRNPNFDFDQTGTLRGKLSICLPRDVDSAMENTVCENLKGNIHPERPFQWLDKQVDFIVTQGDVKVVRFYGSVGEGGTKDQLSLAAFHPAFGFAAPGKAFKDYQSPLVLDLNGNGKLDLVNVWDEKTTVRFDLNGLGENVRTGWVKPTDGLLFLDNGTGCVKNGTQLFGEFTGAVDGQRTFENGFAALAAKLDPKATGTIVAADHANLKVWRDLDQNGICSAKEVSPASRFVKAIPLAYRTIANPKLTEDNEIRLVSQYVARNGSKKVIGDVWFKQRRNEVSWFAKGKNK